MDNSPIKPSPKREVPTTSPNNPATKQPTTTASPEEARTAQPPLQNPLDLANASSDLYDASRQLNNAQKQLNNTRMQLHLQDDRINKLEVSQVENEVQIKNLKARLRALETPVEAGKSA